ncbi:alpha/beta hydrolase family protein [Luteimicrobium subarcticum]|uniref:Bile acid acyltransferase/acyl-CoA thioester hydrolase-like protein n=1 Tax=Luteimicrobium subarcticum TaxID=620910 RepID=A0A2M8WR90_9MICO|nr:prolyl oligopeptidase family serine peptidase [Luteimicrobium subarcticum]PJI93366.1 bile acid acyltransferase/acyl-CoA thioester hydrolase-like protein [Luteimicrobium subarcticum]
MTFRTAATTAVLAVGLAAVGAFAGPEWDPQPVDHHVVTAATSTEIGAPGATTPIGTYPVRTEDVVVHLDGTDVTARLREPVGAGSGLPGMVFVHGAGTGDGATAFRETATELASAGVVTLVPSKNLTTYSLRHRDYLQMAGDYARSVELLRSQPDVDPAKVGVYGESEGTWIVPVMAHEDPSLAFTVMTSSPVVRPREQAAYAVDSYLRNTNVPQGVFRAIPRAVGMELPDGGLDYVDFDVRPYLGMNQPTLVAYGTADASMPIEQGAEEILAAAHTAGNDAVTVRYYGGADHGIRIDGVIDQNFPRDVASFVLGLPGTAGAAPRIAGAQPNQVYLAEPVPSPRWYGNGDVLFGFTVAAVVAALGAPLLWGASVLALRRMRGARRWVGGLARDLRLPMLLAAVGSVMTLVALVVYLFAIARLAVDYSQNSVIVQGGWLGVRLLGLATLVPVAVAVNRLSDRRERRGVLGWLRERVVVDDPASHSTTPGVRAGQPVARGVGGWALFSLLTFAVGMLLLVTAYWGVFQLGI